VLAFLRFIAGRFALVYGVLAMTGVVLALEYAATSLMIPMAPASAGSDGLVLRVWRALALALQLEPGLRTWLWLFVMVLAMRLLLGYVLTVATIALGKKIHRFLSGAIFSHIVLAEPMGLVYTRSVGHYITLAGDDTFKSGTIVATLLQTVVGVLTALVALVVLLQFSLPLFVATVLFLLCSVALTGLMLRAVMRMNSEATDLSRAASTTFVEALNSLRSIRSLHGERFAVVVYAEQIRQYVRALLGIDALKNAAKTVPAMVLLLLAAFALRPGSSLALSESTLFAGTVIIMRIFASLGQAMTSGAQLLTDARAIKDIAALVALAQEAPPHAEALPQAPIDLLELDQVAFSYGDRGPVLRGLSARFEAGRTYAIVGPSGVGKSTLADIVLGLAEPSSGTVRVNAGQLALRAARARIVLVEQSPKIFSTSLRENLLMGADADDAALLAALECVKLDELVRTLDQGLDTRLTYLGENLSGGQRQRLGIARALVRNPQVLILDEATSALDPDTRRSVVHALRARMRAGIIIFVTHDLEIAALADETLALQAADALAANGPR